MLYQELTDSQKEIIKKISTWLNPALIKARFDGLPVEDRIIGEADSYFEDLEEIRAD